MKTPPNSNKTATLTQLNTEAKWAVYLTLIYMAGWVIFAYLMPNIRGLLGFPLWFELSCLFLPAIFIALSVAVLKTIYKDVDLDASPDTPFYQDKDEA